MPDDHRIKLLTDAARKVIIEAGYHPTFSGNEERLRVESVLWLARFDALLQPASDGSVLIRSEVPPKEAPKFFDRQSGQENPAVLPIPMILFCPSCGVQHIDAPEEPSDPPDLRPHWTNPPHKSHLCHYCGHVWRPSDVPTTGVAEIATRGRDDTFDPVRRVIDRVVRFQPQWRHKHDLTLWVELGRGTVDGSTSGSVVVFRNRKGRIRIWLETEFADEFERE